MDGLLLSIDSVVTLLDVSDLETKKLSRQRRLFLMFLLGMVQLNEQEFTEHVQRNSMAKDMKVVRQVMMQTISSGLEGTSPKISTALVKAMTILALQPMAKAMRREEIEYKVVMAKGYLEFFFENFDYIAVYALAFFFAGFIFG